MPGHEFRLNQAVLTAMPSGALWWPERLLLCVADLHLGKSERMARRGGALLPPYETRDTLDRLGAEIDRLRPQQVVCLGDNFDDDAAGEALHPADHGALMRLMAGRHWVWLSGNHDPGPIDLGGENRAELHLLGLTFRHIAAETPLPGEVSGHYHPKIRISGESRPCFLIDQTRVILPAFGTYTGGLGSNSSILNEIMGSRAIAVLTGSRALAVPMRPGA
jgi:uncharacterized protein